MATATAIATATFRGKVLAGTENRRTPSFRPPPSSVAFTAKPISIKPLISNQRVSLTRHLEARRLVTRDAISTHEKVTPRCPKLYTEVGRDSTFKSASLSWKDNTLLHVVHTEHLMKALLEEKTGLVGSIFSKFGVDTTEILRETQKFIEAQPKEYGDFATVGSLWGSDLKTLFNRASKYKKNKYGGSLLSVEHLILGFADDERFGKQLFKTFQIAKKNKKSATKSITRKKSVIRKDPESRSKHLTAMAREEKHNGPKNASNLVTPMLGPGELPAAAQPDMQLCRSPSIVKPCHICHTALIPLIIGFLLAYVLILTAVVNLEGGSLGPRLVGRGDDTEKIGRHFYKILNEVSTQEIPDGLKLPNSFRQLVLEMKNYQCDAKTLLVVMRAMMEKSEMAVRDSILVEVRNKHSEEYCITDCRDCLSQNLTANYSSSTHGHKQPPSPAAFLFAHRDNAYHHVILFTDNISAASVVVTSAVQASSKPEKLVFHIITDEKTYPHMYSWFELNSVAPAIVEVKGVHQFEDDLVFDSIFSSKFRFRSLNHLRMSIPQLFSYLDKVVLLGDDIVVKQDLAPLWEVDLGGKVNGAVETYWGEDEWIMPRPLKNYFNFSHPLIANHLDPEECAWEYGMNVFDLRAWRQTNISETYRFWLKEWDLTMWKPGLLPPALIAFKGHVHIIDSSWNMLGACHSFV